MNSFTKIFSLILTFFTFASGVFAYDIGLYLNDKQDSHPALSMKFGNNSLITKSKYDLERLTPSDIPVLLITTYKSINETAFANLIRYVQRGGKLILSTPQTSDEEAIFKKLAQFIGVNVEKFNYSQTPTEINWVEKTLDLNTLKAGAKTLQGTLIGNTNHLAVFGDIEKHESAISLNPYGSVISWVWGIAGEKKFNEKSMLILLAELLPKEDKSKYSFLHPLFNYDEDIARLKKARAYVEKYQDNIINYSFNPYPSEENLQLAKINELFANYYYKNNDYRSYKKYYKDALSGTYAAIEGTNNIAPAENRGIWFDRGTIVEIKSRSEMAQYFKKLQSAGINTVYFEAFNAGYTTYPSEIATQSPFNKGKDPLFWATEEAHLRNMKIHAWMWVFAVGNDRHNKLIGKPDRYVGPVLEKNLRWALLGEHGNLRPKNQPEFWIDPSNKEGVDFLLKVADEIAQKYHVDGIQLDYIRYPFQSSDNLMGFNHNSTEEFASMTGEKLFFNNEQTNLLWNSWKEENVTNFVKKVSKQAKTTKPSLKISASIFSKSQQNRFNSIQQDWETWLNESYVDMLTPMSYSSNLKALDTNLFYLKPQIGAGLIYPGIALKHVNELAMMEQIAKIREYGYSGVTFFALAQLDNEKANLLGRGLFSLPAVDPTYEQAQSAQLLLKDYKTTLETIKTTTYNLTTTQKQELNTMISRTNSAISRINASQLNQAIEVIYDLEEKNENFFKAFSTHNELRKQTLTSYLKRAENLLKIAAKK